MACLRGPEGKGPRKQAIIFQYWTLTWPLTYTLDVIFIYALLKVSVICRCYV